MSVGDSSAVTQQIRTVFEAGAVGLLSDEQLLERFVSEGGASAEWAFAALVERHGPMVFRVCRNVLRNPDDAEDAFQATFLVLARKAGTIRGRGSTASWLYGVALRVSSDARKAAVRRRTHERGGAAMTPRKPEHLHVDDIGPLLHELVGSLPDKYRAPVVLCYFEGLTHEGAARHLGWPIGTVQGRLARARDLLRSRLIRRGLAPAAAALATAVGPPSASANTVPPALARATVRSAIDFAAGKATAAGTVSTAASTLAKGALIAMSWNRLRINFVVAAAVLGAGLLGLAWAQPNPPAAKRRAVGAERTITPPVGKPQVLNAEGDVGRITWSADGSRLATLEWLVSAGALTGSQAEIWNAKTGEATGLAWPKDFHAGNAWAERVAFSPELRFAAAIVKGEAGQGSRTMLSDLTTRAESDLEPGDSKVIALAFTQDGNTLVGGRSDGQIKVWGVHAQKAGLKVTFAGHPGPVESMALSRDGAILVTTSGQNVGIWPLRDGEGTTVIRFVDVVATAPHPIAIAPNGKYYAVCTCREQNGALVDGAVSLVDIGFGGKGQTLKGHTQPIVALAFSPDGDTLASGGWDKTVRLWNTKTGKLIDILTCPDEVWAVSFSPDGKTLAVGGQGHQLQLWPLNFTAGTATSK
jgi:RNA polymerase sigma factor (sigma-70 family)